MRIEVIEGIGTAHASALSRAGVTHVRHLIQRAATAGGRETLARETGLSTTQLLEWLNHIDLMRIRGVGAEYSDLLDRYEREEVLLFATSDSLEVVHVNVRRSLFAPVQELRIAEQHRNASLEVAGPSSEDPDFATLLVALHRERITCVATFDPRFDPLQIETVPVRDRERSGSAPDEAH